MRTRSVRLPTSKDTRLLVAGVAAFVALFAYLGVAFANTHATSGPTASKTAPWIPHESRLVALGRRRKTGFVVRVRPTGRGAYGALVPTLLSDPPSGRGFVVGVWLRAARPGPIGVEIDEFAPGATSVYLVNTTVSATRRWHHVTFSGRVKGTWLGLGMYVYSQRNGARSWFEVRELNVSRRRS